MKRFLIATLIVLLMSTVWSVQAQTFVGLSWEGNPGLVIGGRIIPITEKLSTFGYVRVTLDSGSYANGLKTQHALAAKIVYHLIDQPNQDIYLIGGGSVDWANIGESKSLTTYLTQAVGFVGTTRAPFLDKIPLINTVFENTELWFSLEFRPQLFDKDTKWQDKGVVGFGLKAGV